MNQLSEADWWRGIFWTGDLLSVYETGVEQSKENLHEPAILYYGKYTEKLVLRTSSILFDIRRML
jgi:hypothetical protein